MKTFTRFGLALSLFSGQVFAANPVGGWYAGFIGEVSYTPNATLTILSIPALNVIPPVPVLPPTPLFPLFPAPPVQGKINYQVGGGGGGQLGYRFYHCYRLEVEALFNSNIYKSLTIGNVKIGRINSKKTTPGLTIKGRTNLITGMVNAYYDFLSPEADTSFAPYVGLGIGYASIQDNLSFYFNGVETGPRLKSTKSTTAGQLILGASYFLDDFTSANLDYRYVTTNNISEHNRLYQRDERFHIHTLNFSMNFAFDSAFS